MEYSSLESGKQIIYLATRLYDYSEKLASARLERAIYQGACDGLAQLSDSTFQRYPIYMPFRDTGEDELHGREDLYEIIYSNDIQRLDRLYALVTYLNDPSKDDGICMEIGYAFGRGAAIVVFNVDIQEYYLESAPHINVQLDPIIKRMVGKIYYFHEMPPARIAIDSNPENMIKFADEYTMRVLDAERLLLESARDSGRMLLLDPMRFVRNLPEAKNNDVMIDMLGNRDEWTKEYSRRLANFFEEKGIKTTICRRYDQKDTPEINELEADDIGEADIQMLLGCRVAIICVEGSEADAGASALIGLGRALGKHIILYYSSDIRISEGKASCYRNLMLEYSANIIARNLNECRQAVLKYLRYGNRTE